MIKHIDMPASKITVFTGADRAAEAQAAAKLYGVNVQIGMLLKVRSGRTLPQRPPCLP